MPYDRHDHRDHPSSQAFYDATTRADQDARDLSTPVDDARPRAVMAPNAPLRPSAAASPAPGPTRAAARDDAPMVRRRFSVGATFLGWSVAAFFTLVFLAIMGILLGTDYLSGGADELVSLDASEVGLANLAIGLIATFLAFLIGGYAAGRIALWNGMTHGIAIVGWAVLFGLVGLLAGATLADDIAMFTNMRLDTGGITIGVIAGVLATLIAQLAGAALGGSLGERHHERLRGIAPRREGERRIRGRPF